MLVDGFLIRRSLLHERRKLIKILHYQHYVFLELYGLCVLEGRLELRQVLFLFRLGNRFVDLERRDHLLDR